MPEAPRRLLAGREFLEAPARVEAVSRSQGMMRVEPLLSLMSMMA
jgi:hypothetical protein